MNASGLLLLIAGAWVVAQVLRGDALKRLGILTDPAAAGG